MKKICMAIITTLIFLGTLQYPSYAQQLSDQQMINIAQVNFEKDVSQNIINEYIFNHITKLNLGQQDDNHYLVTWIRSINGIHFANDRYYVVIDSVSGDISDKQLIYSGPIANLLTNPSISKEQAIQTALNAYKDAKLTTAERNNPYLEIKDNELLWMINLEFPQQGMSLGGARLWLGLDANTGETKVFNPSSGSSIQQVPTSFNATQYYLETYGIYAVLMMALILGGIVAYKKGIFTEIKRQ